MAAAVSTRRGPRRLDRAALTGVLVREAVNFASYWRSSAFSSVMQPTIYLLALGYGFGTLVTKVDGIEYVQFVGTGTVATAVLFSSVFPAMFGVFAKYSFQRTYDAILAAPVDTEELVTAEALAIAARAGVFGCVPLLVTMVAGLDPGWGMLLVPPIAFVAGYGWAAFGILVAAIMRSFDDFGYVNSTIITPLFLVAGTFFPIEGLPHWARVAANFNPLYHCVELVRHACFGFEVVDLWHLGFLLGFGLLFWRLAVSRMTRRLVT
jgi:lipooligosaccharide transport system permease protein